MYSPLFAPTSKKFSFSFLRSANRRHITSISPLVLTAAPDPKPWDSRSISTSFKANGKVSSESMRLILLRNIFFIFIVLKSDETANRFDSELYRRVLIEIAVNNEVLGTMEIQVYQQPGPTLRYQLRYFR